MTTREALKELRDNLAIHVMAAPMFGGDHCEINVMEVKAMIEEADAALKEPLRNCDMGSVAEQTARMRENCNRYKPSCKGCKYVTDLNEENCWLAWAQSPYDPTEADA